MIDLKEIKKPVILLDEEKCRNNIARMAGKAYHSGVNFRPHFKTHQSVTIGEWFREAGVRSITVSSVTMALHFYNAGWKDITIAIPFNHRESDILESLSGKAEINILTPDNEHLSGLSKLISKEVSCWIKLNTGYNRSGTDWDDQEELTAILKTAKIHGNIRIKGLLTHAGHSYKAGSTDEIRAVYADTIEKLTASRSLAGYNELLLSSGDTPSCSIMENFAGIDEIRPGNFVFYDLMQSELGSCKPFDIAVAVACPVIEKNSKRNEIIIYGGGVHLSKEQLKLRDGRTVYGEVILPDSSGWIFPDRRYFLKSLSQEHGIISADEAFLRSIRPGDLVGILPVHSCMTADLLREYWTFTGKRIKDFSSK